MYRSISLSMKFSHASRQCNKNKIILNHSEMKNQFDNCSAQHAMVVNRRWNLSASNAVFTAKTCGLSHIIRNIIGLAMAA